MDFFGFMYAWEVLGYFPNSGFGTRSIKSVSNKFTSVIIFNDSDENLAVIFLYCLILNTEHWKYIQARAESSFSVKKRGEAEDLFKLKPILRPKPILYSLTTNRAKKLINVVNKLNNTGRKKRLLVSAHIWLNSLTRDNRIDTLRDCISSMEGILETTGSLNIAIKASYYLDNKKIFKFIYFMNNLRNDYVHGKKIPELTKKDIDLLVKLNYLCLKKYSNGTKIPTMHEVVDIF